MHDVESLERRERTNEHGAAVADAPSDRVHAPVHAVDAVDIGGARRPVQVGGNTLVELAASRGASIPESRVIADVPAGFISFCTRFADQCSIPEKGPSRITLTESVWQELNKVNDQINIAIRPIPDKAHFGRAEFWNIPTDGGGDCEDFALTKRKELLLRGLPAAALRIAIVLTWRQERHAVLTIATDRGDFVLDSVERNVLNWNKTDFTWIQRQDPENAWGWVALSKASPSYLASIARAPLGSSQ